MSDTEKDRIFQLHAHHTGVLNIQSQLEVHNRQDLARAYTPGVAFLSQEIAKNPRLKRQYTLSGKLIVLITDGSAVLGLGNLGPAAGLPVIEGKALLYKDLAKVNALPLALDQVPVDEAVTTIKNISQTFAGIHLEDIAAPRCFEIETKLSQALSIPVYHDDQEGTAIVVLAGLLNAVQVVGKELTQAHIVINGVGASGYATARLLHAKLTIICAPLVRGRIATIVPAVTTIVTPGDSIDVVVTEYGIAINPRRSDLMAALQQIPGVPVLSIAELQALAQKKVGQPQPLTFTEQTVALIEYRDGTIIDQIKAVQD